MQVDIITLSAPETLPIRQMVFAPDQPQSQSMVPEDESGEHFGLTVDGRLVGVASLFMDGRQARLRKLAVLEDFRSLGLGSRLIRTALQAAQAASAETVWCRIRVTSLPFYQRFGFAELPDSRHQKGSLMYCHIQAELNNL